MSARGWFAVAGLLALVAGCQDDVTTVFPPGLEPLEDNTAPEPPGDELVTVQGGDELKWVHGRGYLHGAPAAVWAATKDPERMAAACETDRHQASPGEEPQYEYGFKIHYEVEQVLTVAWDEQWRYGTVTGTPDAPVLAIIRYQKVYGSDFITTLEGSMILKATDDPAVTALEFVEHLNALGGSHDQMKTSMVQRFGILRALLRDEPAPACP